MGKSLAQSLNAKNAVGRDRYLNEFPNFIYDKGILE